MRYVINQTTHDVIARMHRHFWREFEAEPYCPDKTTTFTDDGDYTWMTCGACGKKVYHLLARTIEFHYCPWCGARVEEP